MSLVPDRYQIINHPQFWTALAYKACEWLQKSDNKFIRRYWVDDFQPENIANTKGGAEVKGTAWVGDAPHDMQAYRLSAFLPQKLLHRPEREFHIDQIEIDEERRTVEVWIL